MAKEIKCTISLSVQTALGITTEKTDTIAIDMSGEAVYHGIQDVTSSAAALEYTEQALMGSSGDTAGWMFLKNLSTADIITLGDDATHTDHIVKLKPGEFALFRANKPIFADCTSGTAKLETLVIEN
tara:strand:+ start:1006 stop:1386 length:381 start_codon:yes stop_codon:yes gene_type:complete